MPSTAPTLSAHDALTWLTQDPDRQPRTLLALLSLGASDPLDVATTICGDPTTCTELAALSDALPGPLAPAMLTKVVTTVGQVGARVWLEEPENVEEWAAVAAAVRDFPTSAQMSSWPYSPGTRTWEALSSVKVISQVRDAGRSPHYALAMLEAGARAKVAPNTFGFGADITPAMLISLSAAGIRDAAALKEITKLGLTSAEALTLGESGLTPGQIRYAAAAGLPAKDWAANLAGLPDTWFGVDDGRASSFLVDAGFTWAELRGLADAGWDRFMAWDWREGLRCGPRRRSGQFTRQTLLLAASLGSRSDLESWLSALTSGKADPSGDRLAKTLPPLTSTYRGITALLDDVARLKDAGLRPSHLNTYRAAGCATVDDVLAASAAGITAKRAKELTEAHGKRRFTHDPLRMESFGKLLEAHRADGAERAL